MPKRSKHNLGYYNLLTLDLGQLVPIGITEALPADTIQHHVDVLIRLSPLAAPVMHPMTARVHHFFVPHRLVWDGWEDFITGGADGMNEDSPPTILTTNNEKDLLDYFGLVQFPGLEVSALPIRAFNLIYNEYYRDQDLVPERDPEDLTIPFVSWEKDYFTTARPWTQKGEDVTIPMGELAPVVGLAHNTQAEAGNLTTTDEGATVDGADYRGVFSQVGDYPRVYADLAETVGANINDVRRAFAVQRYQEARARYGSRYVEYLRYLGARPLDERLQRPEFLGGGKSQVAISEVMQTAPELQAENEREFGVGDMYGHGIAAMRSNKYRRTINEHGYVISMLSVRPKAMYQAAVERHWLRKDKEDFFQKELQHIGQQEIFNAEVYGAHSEPEGVFGYNDRYMEYRQSWSHACAEFRSVLDYWHLARKFQSEPVLNQDFIDCNPSKRIFNEQTMNSLWIMAQHRMVARRLVDRSAMPRIF